MSKKDDVQQNDDPFLMEEDEVLTAQTDGQDLGELKDELEQVKQTATQMEVQLKRAVADYQNLEKRVAEGRSELAQWATSDLIKRLLPVLHHFDQAISGAGEEERKSGWFRGVELAVKQLQEILRSEGLDEIEADGQFDPALHEAVDTKEGENDKILEVAQKGFTLNGKVLQPAKVVVGRKDK
jgi:molecular chaperone GrpE